MNSPRPRVESHLRSLLKAVSWRCVGTLDTFVVSFLVLRVTGAADTSLEAVKISGGIAGVEIVTKIALYYLHERAWARLPFGRPRPLTLEESAAENVP
ncbi:MAG: DUF2061 domain-containing protein [Opitutus sp.]|nr:DUF2061 domain-containing protein [Opitutus sp.]